MLATMNTRLKTNGRRNPRRPGLTIGLLLTPDFTLLPFAGFIDALRLAADDADRSRPIHCSWDVMSVDDRAVRSSCGVSVATTSTLKDPREFDYLVVVSGLLRSTPPSGGPTEDYLRRAASLGVPLIGICTGSFVLARAGLMSGHRTCVSWFHHADFIAEFPHLEVVSDRLYLDDGLRITCAGGTSAVHLATALIDRHCGTARARKALRIMIEDQPRPPAAPQPQPGAARFRSTSHPVVRRALLMLERHLSEPLAITALAADLHTSPRNLERLFATHLGMTPAETLMTLRTEEARRMVVESSLPLAHVAELCGFHDASHFSRRFRHAFSETPLQTRKRSLQMR